MPRRRGVSGGLPQSVRVQPDRQVGAGAAVAQGIRRRSFSTRRASSARGVPCQAATGSAVEADSVRSLASRSTSARRDESRPARAGTRRSTRCRGLVGFRLPRRPRHPGPRDPAPVEVGEDPRLGFDDREVHRLEVVGRLTSHGGDQPSVSAHAGCGPASPADPVRRTSTWRAWRLGGDARARRVLDERIHGEPLRAGRSRPRGQKACIRRECLVGPPPAACAAPAETVACLVDGSPRARSTGGRDPVGGSAAGRRVTAHRTRTASRSEA
jgi:hypothetical protein